MSSGSPDVLVLLAAAPAFDTATTVALTRRLDAVDRARAARMAVDADRYAFLASRALLLQGLAAVGGAGPWRLLREEGRVRVDAPIRFSLSHTRGYAACALASEGEVGIDLEYLDRQDAWTTIEDHALSAAERRCLPPAGPERGRRLIKLWTLKEAVAKAMGVGLDAVPSICVRLEPPRLLDGPPGLWRLYTHETPDGVGVALAVRGAQPRVRWVNAALGAAGPGFAEP
jgi:4'-phosphopantetheinyl transferase